ncbi:MAG: Ig-like domain-containing protein, partial [Planctomycetota bacterium]
MNARVGRRHRRQQPWKSRRGSRKENLFPRSRRLSLEPLEERTLLALAPVLVDLQPGSDSGLYDDDNLTNVDTPTIDITSAQPGDAVFVYRDGQRLGLARQLQDSLYSYTFLPDQLQEGGNTVTARCFDGFEESDDSTPLLITLDTIGPRITGTGPHAPVNGSTDALDLVTVTFSEAITFGPGSSDNFWLDDVSITGPEGEIVPTGITDLGGNQYEITFAAQTRRGAYAVSVGPEIIDPAGNLMDQDEDGLQGEAKEDVLRFGANVVDADIVFTTDTLIAPDDSSYDGHDILIDGTTVTIDGAHAFNSMHLINGAVVTYSGETQAEGTFSLYADETLTAPGLTGSYVDESLRGYQEQDDWRETQTIAGIRVDPDIQFTSNGWGSRAEVGLTGGSDEDWEGFSVQWDGWIEVLQDNTALKTRSDDGSRMWIDVNQDGLLGESGPEFIDNRWGTGGGANYGPASVFFDAGVYRVRLQYEEGTGNNTMQLLPGAKLDLAVTEDLIVDAASSVAADGKGYASE